MTTGTLYTISAPSGAGKTSLVKALLERLDGIGMSVSHTTRACREGEQEGVDYHFTTTETFLDMIATGQFLEHAEVFRNYYGTSEQAVKDLLSTGQDAVLEIDWQGMNQVKHLRPDCVSISILPPSLAALKSRLQSRESDSDEEIEHRMSEAKEEMSHFSECDYVIINNDFDTALNELIAIVVSHRLQTNQQANRHEALISALLK